MCRSFKRYFQLFIFLAASLFLSPAYSQTASADCSTAGAQQLTVGATCTFVAFTIDNALGSPAIVACTGETPTGDAGWGWFTATCAVTRDYFLK